MLTTARAGLGRWHSLFIVHHSRHSHWVPYEPGPSKAWPQVSCPQRFPTTYSQIHSTENPWQDPGRASVCFTELTWPRNAETTWSRGAPTASRAAELDPAGGGEWEREREPRIQSYGSTDLGPAPGSATCCLCDFTEDNTQLCNNQNSKAMWQNAVCSLNGLPFPPGQQATQHFSASFVIREHHTTEFLPIKHSRNYVLHF